MTDYTELQAELAAKKAAGWQCTDGLSIDTVMALIAENERLKTLRSTTERDLAQELEVWRNGPSCWSCGDTGDVHDIVGEWRGQCDCNAAKLISVSSERDQLKAENERLVEDYDKAWRHDLNDKKNVQALAAEVARLSAENETLRMNDRRYQRVRDIACRVRASEGFRLEVRLPSLAGYDFNTAKAFDAAIDAAMGKGEKS